jgi:hypothetical protein
MDPFTIKEEEMDEPSKFEVGFWFDPMVFVAATHKRALSPLGFSPLDLSKDQDFLVPSTWTWSILPLAKSFIQN